MLGPERCRVVGVVRDEQPEPGRDLDSRTDEAVVEREQALRSERLGIERREHIRRDREAMVEEIGERGQPPAGKHAVTAQRCRLPVVEPARRTPQPFLVIALGGEHRTEPANRIHGVNAMGRRDSYPAGSGWRESNPHNQLGRLGLYR